MTPADRTATVSVMDEQSTLERWVRTAANFRFDRSSGPGGQNVNKVNSKATLTLSLADGPFEDWTTVAERLGARVNADGELVVQCDETRSQPANRERAILRAVALLAGAMQRKKKRRPSRPSRAAKERRMEEKKRRSALKRERNWRES